MTRTNKKKIPPVAKLKEDTHTDLGILKYELKKELKKRKLKNSADGVIKFLIAFYRENKKVKK